MRLGRGEREEKPVMSAVQLAEGGPGRTEWVTGSMRDVPEERRGSGTDVLELIEKCCSGRARGGSSDGHRGQ